MGVGVRGKRGEKGEASPFRMAKTAFIWKFGPLAVQPAGQVTASLILFFTQVKQASREKRENPTWAMFFTIDHLALSPSLYPYERVARFLCPEKEHEVFISLLYNMSANFCRRLKCFVDKAIAVAGEVQDRPGPRENSEPWSRFRKFAPVRRLAF